MLNKELKHRRQRVIAVVAHDPELAIGKDGDLLKRHPADMRWFKRMTDNRVCIVGTTTHREVGDLQRRIWLQVTRKAQPDTAYQSKDIHDAISQARQIAIDKRMDSTTVIVGGGQIYNAYLQAGLIDSIYATLWPEVEGGTTFIDNYRTDPNWILVEEWPLEENDATYHSEGLAVPLVQHWIRKRLLP